MDNLDIWNSLKTTPSEHVKPIVGKSYKGNSVKPQYVIYRLTEKFGPIGIGWGFDILNDKILTFECFGQNDKGEVVVNKEYLHTAEVGLWYVLDGKTSELIKQIGQTKIYYQGSKSIQFDEDAPKKSVTDALTKCASYIGVAADIYMGEWDGCKYTTSPQQQDNQTADYKQQSKPKPNYNPEMFPEFERKLKEINPDDKDAAKKQLDILGKNIKGASDSGAITDTEATKLREIFTTIKKKVS